MSDPKAFRRAYVETWMQPVIELIDCDDGCRIMVGSSVFATVSASGAFIPGWSNATLTTNPKIVRELAASIFRIRLRRLWDTYTRLTGDATDYEGLDGNRVFSFTQRTHIAKVVTTTMKLAALRVDPEALRIFRSVASSSGALLARLSHPNAETGLRWRQALSAYPLLTMKLLHDISTCDGLHESGVMKQKRQITHVVEAGLPLVPFLAKVFAIPESVVRRYQGVHPRRVAKNYCAVNDHVRNLPMHCELPPHLRPHTKADFVAADILFQRLGVPARHVKSVTTGMKTPLGKELRIERLAGFRDVARCLSRLLVDLDESSVDDLLFAGRSLGALVRLNEAWHRAHREATAEAEQAQHEVAGTSNSAAWQPLTHGPIDLGELTAVELCTRKDLLDEGVRMKHCVGGYADAAVAGKYRIISLRDRLGASVSTTCFYQGQDGTVRLQQHYASRNTPPSATAIAAVKRLIPKLRSAKYASRAIWPAVKTHDELMDEAEALINKRMDEFWLQTMPGLAQILASPRNRRGSRRLAHRR